MSRIEVIDFASDCDDIAVIRMDEDDTEQWWWLVVDHAIDNEGRYHLDEADPQLTTADGENYDSDLVHTWAHANVEPPQWRWHRKARLPEDRRDDEYEWELLTSTAATRPNRLWWRGAVIRTRRTEASLG